MITEWQKKIYIQNECSEFDENFVIYKTTFRNEKHLIYMLAKL